MTEQTPEYWIRRAKEIATKVHEGQFRNDGGPYIEHPARVAEKASDRLKPIAWLHDTIEDHPDKISLGDLKREEFPSYIVDAVGLLTHKEGDSNVEYWKKIVVNKDAVAVKLLDIQDNLDSNPSEYAKQKYARALQLFQQAGYSLDSKNKVCFESIVMVDNS